MRTRIAMLAVVTVALAGCGGGEAGGGSTASTDAPGGTVGPGGDEPVTTAEEITPESWAPTQQELAVSGTHVYDQVVESLDCGKVPAHQDPRVTLEIEIDEEGINRRWVEGGGNPVFYPREGPNRFGHTLDAQDGGRDYYNITLGDDGLVISYDDDGVPCFRYTLTLAE